MGKLKQTVYLSGGFKSGWQEKVKREARGFEFKDPSKHGLSDPREYTEWDLAAIRSSDIVFAYLEHTNPTGFGLALEVGFAAALDKLIILVDEKGVPIIRETSSVNCDSLESGIDLLKSMMCRDQTTKPLRTRRGKHANNCND